MSLNQYQFQTMLRMERMTRAERLEADEQAARMAHRLWRAGHALVRGLRTAARSLRLDPNHGGATMQPRRSS